MAPPTKPPERSRRPPSKDPVSDSDGDEKGPSPTLWVGHLPTDIDDADLLKIFKEHKALDCVTMHSSRTYAFVYFGNADDAAAARDALQGTKIRGATMKMEFARPAKAGKHLWIGGISSSISKEEIEDEFSKFGRIEEYNFLRDRNSAFIDYYKIEDAITAQKDMNGKDLAGSHIRVDFQRSQPARKDYGSEPWFSADGSRNFRDSSKRYMPQGGRRGDGQPSNILWIGHPPSVHIDEQMLHGAMILFGEIERIKCFPSRNYAFVEFRSIDEARRAKEGLQGRLFNDSRIQILFSSSDIAPHNKDNMPILPGFKRPAQDMFFSDAPYGPLDLLGSGGPVGADGFPGHLPYGSNFHSPRAPNWKRLSPPAAGILPAPDLRQPFKSTPDRWDGLDPREPKRSRLAGSLPSGDPPFVRVERHGSGSDYCWRGVIAKGGTPVCRARCVPIGNGIDSPFPEIVNCSARTGLDLLAKHYEEAIGFDIAFFLPDSEEEFASYTEFVRYLGQKKRAGVAKFDDGTTLFLVPPSDFLTDVLKVAGPPRLYGVVLKQPQQPISLQSQQSQETIHLSPSYPEPQLDPLQKVHGLSKNEGHSRGFHGSSAPHAAVAKPMGVYPNGQHTNESAPTGYTSNLAVSAPLEVSLTPELIASLATLIPGNNQSSVSGPVQMPAPYPTSPQGWRHEHQGSFSGTPAEQTGRQSEQLGYQISNQTKLMSQFPAESSMSNVPDHSVQSLIDSSRIQDPALNFAHVSTVPSQPFQNYSVPSEHRQLSVSQSNQQFQFSSHNIQSGLQTADGTGLFHLPANQQPNNLTASAPGQIGSALQSQMGMPFSADRATSEFSAQVQQTGTAPSNSVQGTPDGEADKNQRYQSTLQLAASLLLQIQQQQQTNASAVQGHENQ